MIFGQLGKTHLTSNFQGSECAGHQSEEQRLWRGEGVTSADGGVHGAHGAPVKLRSYLALQGHASYENRDSYPDCMYAGVQGLDCRGTCVKHVPLDVRHSDKSRRPLRDGASP